MHAAARDKAPGHGDADLKRVKYAVTNAKGGALEMGAQARFAQGARRAALVRASRAALQLGFRSLAAGGTR